MEQVTINGYVVRGLCDGAAIHAEPDREAWCGDHVSVGCNCPLLPTVSEACAAMFDLIASECVDVRIYTVADDGTETPLPTYAEALAKLAELDAIGAALVAEMERPTRREDQTNRDHWQAIGLNGGKYIDDAEDRTNYLLNEHDRLRGEVERLRKSATQPSARQPTLTLERARPAAEAIAAMWTRGPEALIDAIAAGMVVAATNRDDTSTPITDVKARALAEAEEFYRPEIERMARSLIERGKGTPKERDKARCLARWNEAGERIAECGDLRDGDGCDRAGRSQQNWTLALDLHSGAEADGAWAELRRRYDLLAEHLMACGGTHFIDACRAAVAEERWGDLVERIVDLEHDHVFSGYLRWVKDEQGILVTESTGKPPCRIPENLDPGSPFAGEYPRAPWRPKVGDRVQTADRLSGSAAYQPSHGRRRNALGEVVRRRHSPIPRWDVRHDDGTEAPYDEDELRPA